MFLLKLQCWILERCVSRNSGRQRHFRLVTLQNVGKEPRKII